MSLALPAGAHVGAPRRPIALIGLRCAGKSAAGVRLAARLDLAFVDLDERVVQLAARAGWHGAPAGRGVACAGDVLLALGRGRFRALEAAALRQALEPEAALVLATGGGVVERDENRTWLRRAARVLWLDARSETLLRRRERDPTPRPALFPDADPRRELTLLGERRTRWYAELSEARVETDDLDLDGVVQALVQALGGA